jgi:hypothetical protein
MTQDLLTSTLTGVASLLFLSAVGYMLLEWRVGQNANKKPGGSLLPLRVRRDQPRHHRHQYRDGRDDG